VARITPNESVRSQIENAIRSKNISRVALELDVNKGTLATYVLGGCSSGSVVLIESHWHARNAASAEPVRA
jgi:hypothetical protein